MCKRENESGTKTFRIRDESGKISSSVNLVLNYNYESDWFIELSNNKLSNNKLSDNNLASELVENRSFLN